MPSQRNPFTARLSEDHEKALARILRARKMTPRQWLTEKIEQESGYKPSSITIERNELEEILDTLRAMKNSNRYLIPEPEEPKRKGRGKKEGSNAFTDNLDF